MTTDDVRTIEAKLLLDGIHARYGYDLRDYVEPSLSRRVDAALRRSGLTHLGELLHQVLSDADLFARVLDDLTIRASDAFRDPAFYLAFREEVIPLLRTYPTLKLWHAGCATGEEAYSSAVLLEEAGLLDRSQIYATDFNPSAIEHARNGMYPQERLAVFEENYTKSGGRGRFADYVTGAYGGFIMHKRLRDHILFFHHDLASDHGPGEMQVVFCRNVLIYFGEALRRRALGLFAESLRPGGILCLGSSERLRDDDLPFSPFVGAQRIYRRGADR